MEPNKIYSHLVLGHNEFLAYWFGYLCPNRSGCDAGTVERAAINAT